MIPVLLAAAVPVTLLFLFSLFFLFKNRSAAFQSARELFDRLRKKLFSRGSRQQSTAFVPYVVTEPEKGGTSPGGTLLLPILYVDQLDPRTLKTVRRFQIRSIPEYGVSISRPDCSHGDIILMNFCKEAFTVSEDHARILKDEDGFFIQDNGSHNLMHVKGCNTPVAEAAIEEGMIVFLGTQPLRFTFPNLFSSGSPDTPGQTRISPYGPEDPDTAGPVTYSHAPQRRRRRAANGE